MKTLALSFRTSCTLQFVLGLSLLVLTAQISIPLRPVPITLGSVGVLLIALVFEKKQAIAMIASYLLLGAIGLPVFADFSGGIAYVVGATGGYLLGFWFAVLAVASLREHMANETLFKIFVLCVLGTAIIFIFGITWLSYLFSFEKAISVGLLPFIIPGIVKAGLLASTVRGIKQL
jgi:biotin transport system substrate-specific component